MLCVKISSGWLWYLLSSIESCTTQKRLTKRAPDAGDSGAIPSLFLRLSIFLVGRRSAARPSAGNANRWATLLKIMFGIPYKKITFQSKLTPSEILSRLQTVTSRSFWYMWGPKDKDFVGSVSTDGFRIHRNLRNRNTYLPVLSGEVLAENKGSQIVVTMSLDPVAVLLMLGLLVFVLRIVLSPGGEIGLKLLIFVWSLILHLGMYAMGFAPEVSRAEERFQEIFESN